MTANDYEYFDADTGEGLTDYELHERYDDFLDEVYGEVSVAGLDYLTSRVLKECDPIAYRCGFNDWLDAELTDGMLTEDPPAESGE